MLMFIEFIYIVIGISILLNIMNKVIGVSNFIFKSGKKYCVLIVKLGLIQFYLLDKVIGNCV